MRTILPLLAIMLAAGALLAACGPSKEARLTAENLGQLNVIAERGAQIGTVAFMEQRRGGVLPFEAEILDANKRLIGRIRGARVEGFGTRIHRIEWFPQESGG
ncbi:MAG TPA: hypothetical protein ENN65_07720 [Candidatus Hydrogenedentes bacterium]|nr:hypothetical protein [Candidatus Hydrogenedentota bacterium]